MTPRARLSLPLAAMLALAMTGIGPSFGDEAAAPGAESAEEAAEPAAAATEAEPDCGCGARSPAQLLETQRQMSDPGAEPGS